MQIVKALVKSQQFALKELGLYSGPIDGNWNPQAAQAQMGLVYRDGGHQTHGQPFAPGNRLPRGLVWASIGSQPVVAIQDAKEQDGGEKFLERFQQELGGAKPAKKEPVKNPQPDEPQPVVEQQEAKEKPGKAPFARR